MMNEYRVFVLACLILAPCMTILVGCEYDVVQPMWDKPAPTVTTPTITGVIPPQAAPAGVNMITIQGQSFSDSLTDMTVYFNSTMAEIVSTSSTSLTVRRPNLFAASAEIKIVSAKAYLAAKISPYSVDTVMERYGAFVANIPLAAVAVDGAEDIYVVALGTPYTFWKVTPDGAASQLSITDVSPAIKRTYTDARIHNGNLYLIGRLQREIQVADLSTGQLTRWTRLPSGLPVNFGDFDANGNFYTGGTSTDLCVVPPNPPVDLTTAQIKTAGSYRTEEILAIRVFDGYLYVASRQANTTTPAKIWSHTIDAAGNLGSQSLVVDLAGFSSSAVRAIAFSATGQVYIAIDDVNPLVVFDPATNALDYFYKGILPSNGKQSAWGSGQNLYMISNDPSAQTANKWNIVRVRMGTPGVSYF
jgi:hypothetical protein